MVDDETDAVCGCFLGSLFPNIRVKDVHLEQKNLDKNIEEGWDVVTPIAPSQGGLPGENGEAGREAIHWQLFNTIHAGLAETKNEECGQFSNVNQERLLRKREENPSIVGLERLPRKKEERLPRKRSGEEGRLN